MAATGTPTPNIGLRIPQGTDPASVDDINYNSNLLDTKLGAVGNESVQDQIDALNSKITNKAKLLINSNTGLSAVNVDLNKYRILIFKNLYNQTMMLSHDYVANQVLYTSMMRYYSADIPLVTFNYVFKINSDRTGIYIDTTESKQVNINTTGADVYPLDTSAYFHKVYGIEG